MKRLLIAVGLGLISGSLWAACHGPYCWDDTGATMSGGLGLAGVTISGSTPTIVNRMVVDSTYRVYISTCTTDIGCWAKVGAQ